MNPGTLGGRQRSRNGKIQSPQQYADTVRSYSQLSAKNSLYAGTHLESLASYLQLPLERVLSHSSLQNNNGSQSGDIHEFLSLYELNPATPCRARHFKSVTDFEASTLNSSSLKLVFMRGLPSPEWLLAIGVKFQVDPEFFQQHLDFNEALPHHFVYPSLPSANTSMARLRTTTIGYSPLGFGSSRFGETVETRRKANANLMNTYRQQMKARLHSNLGDSIVRELSIHDLEHFSIEQDISIFIGQHEESWFALVWFDNGEDLRTGFSPWSESAPGSQSQRTNYLPVVRYQPGVALDSRGRQAPSHHETGAMRTSISQSASWLHLNYGRTLDGNLVANNPFYALHEIFCFVAYSEIQFLNMLESKIKKELDASTLVSQKNPTLSNLLYNQQVLDRHIQRIRENLTFIRRYAPTSRLQGSTNAEKLNGADLAADELLRDFEDLLSRATILSEHCNRGMQVVMNNATIKESREAISQAKGIAMLTRLAFIFIPLTYVTSVFGMNVSQFGQGELSIWMWPAVSIPVFGLSLLFVRKNIISYLKDLISKLITNGKPGKGSYYP